MFGYIVTNTPDLRIREFDLYHAYYCGVCRSLKERGGVQGQLTLSYDTTFLALLLTSLYEPQDHVGQTRCMVHPLRRHPLRTNEFTRYAADIGLLLSYYSCLDDWQDEKKLSRLLMGQLLSGKSKKAGERWKQKAEVIRGCLADLSACEQAKETDPDRVSGCFGHLLAECFACRQDEWEETLRRMGFFLGKFIYLLDAYDDLDKDEKKGSYNPLLPLRDTPGFEQRVKGMLTMMMGECCRAFETLPIVTNTDILRNVLYSGVWTRYNTIQDEKRKARERAADGAQDRAENGGSRKAP